MTTHQIRFSLIFVSDSPDPDFEAVLDRLYTELLEIEERETDIIDPDLAASLTELTADVEMGVTAETIFDAQVRAITSVRTALHAIEVGTPGWEAAIASITAPTPRELQDA